MKYWIAALVVLAAVVVPTRTYAGVQIVAPDIILPFSNSVQTGFIDFVVTDDMSSGLQISSYDIGIVLTGTGAGTDIQFDTMTPITTVTSPTFIFDGQSTDITESLTTTEATRSEFLDMAPFSVALPASAGLIRVAYTIAAGFEGSVTIDLDTAISATETALFDENFELIAATIVNGSITVIPEPASVSILALAAVTCLTRRRRFAQ